MSTSFMNDRICVVLALWCNCSDTWRKYFFDLLYVTVPVIDRKGLSRKPSLCVFTERWCFWDPCLWEPGRDGWSSFLILFLAARAFSKSFSPYSLRLIGIFCPRLTGGWLNSVSAFAMCSVILRRAALSSLSAFFRLKSQRVDTSNKSIFYLNTIKVETPGLVYNST